MTAPSIDSPALATTAGPRLPARMGAEALGTFILVFGGCGTAILAGYEVGHLGIALAFGLSVVVGAYAFGPISGGHFNPAVTLGLATAGRFPWRQTGAYIVAQVVGGIVATSALAAILAGGDDTLTDAKLSGFASNGYGELSEGSYGLQSAILVEIILTAVFLFVIIGATSRAAAPGFGGLAIGLTLTLIHLVSIPVDNTSVNPARSLATVLYTDGGEYWGQLWVFLLFPIVGAMLAGEVWKTLYGD